VGMDIRQGTLTMIAGLVIATRPALAEPHLE
jgi:hypothetical protein